MNGKIIAAFLLFAALITLSACTPTEDLPRETDTETQKTEALTDTESEAARYSLRIEKDASEKWTLYTDVPGVSVSHVEDCGDGRTLIICESTEVEAFDLCLSALSEYETVSRTELGGSRYATLRYGKHTLNVGYPAHDRRLRFTVTEESEPTEGFKVPTESSSACEPMLIFHGLAWSEEGYKTYQSGLSILIRLSDGRFIVVDGGYSRDRDADDIYRLIKDNTPSGSTPTIAAWLVTHAHGDHSQAVAAQLSKKYAKALRVEQVVFCQPSYTMFASEAVRGNYNAIYKAADAFSASLIRPHAGDRYYFGDAVVDVLFTPELLCPVPFTNFNTSSTVYSITLAGQRIMITGDATNEVFSVLVGAYGKSLKCDIVQVAHHGETTGAPDTESIPVMQGYRHMSPSLVLWPSGEETYKKEKNRSYNLTLTLLPSVRETVVAGDRDHIISLPYAAE